MGKKNKEKKAEENAANEEQVQDTVEQEENAEHVDSEEMEEGEEQDENLLKVTEINDKYLRLYSDFENFRKRTIKEKGDLISSASEGVIKELLPVLDDFERAFVNNEPTTETESVLEGFQLIYNKLYKTLESKGLKPMNSIGEPFDSDHHEAVTNIPAPTKKEKGKVVDVIEKGYFLNDKVLRYAKVVVGQ